MGSLRRRLAGDETGAAVVEFALVAPLFLLLVFAVIDVGRAYYTVNQLATAVREGARAAAVLPNPAGSSEEIREVVRRAAPNLGGSDIGDDRIEVVVDGPQQLVTVRVRDYPLRFITPFGALIGNSSFALTREATFHWESAPAT